LDKELGSFFKKLNSKVKSLNGKDPNQRYALLKILMLKSEVLQELRRLQAKRVLFEDFSKKYSRQQ